MGIRLFFTKWSWKISWKKVGKTSSTIAILKTFNVNLKIHNLLQNIDNFYVIPAHSINLCGFFVGAALQSQAELLKAFFQCHTMSYANSQMEEKCRGFCLLVDGVSYVFFLRDWTFYVNIRARLCTFFFISHIRSLPYNLQRTCFQDNQFGYALWALNWLKAQSLQVLCANLILKQINLWESLHSLLHSFWLTLSLEDEECLPFNLIYVCAFCVPVSCHLFMYLFILYTFIYLRRQSCYVLMFVLMKVKNHQKEYKKQIKLHMQEKEATLFPPTFTNNPLNF